MSAPSTRPKARGHDPGDRRARDHEDPLVIEPRYSIVARLKRAPKGSKSSRSEGQSPKEATEWPPIHRGPTNVRADQARIGSHRPVERSGCCFEPSNAPSSFTRVTGDARAVWPGGTPGGSQDPPRCGTRTVRMASGRQSECAVRSTQGPRQAAAPPSSPCGSPGAGLQLRERTSARSTRLAVRQPVGARLVPGSGFRVGRSR
jgi:hypothetical protein